jgi:N6-adenosine-specific RNA methylase IME4
MKVDIFNTDKKYKVIVADPPWLCRNKKTGGSLKSGAANKYRVTSLYDLQCMPVRYITEPDSILIMWYLSSMPDDALELAKAWGFKKLLNMNGFIWGKMTKKGKRNFGMGFGTRASTESCLIAYNGSISRIVKDKAIRNYFEAPMPVDESGDYIHSAKPDEFFDLVDRLVGTDCNRLEMFARKPRDNFDRFGDQA